jgi:hypothetical protein
LNGAGHPGNVRNIEQWTCQDRQTDSRNVLRTVITIFSAWESTRRGKKQATCMACRPEINPEKSKEKRIYQLFLLDIQ